MEKSDLIKYAKIFNFIGKWKKWELKRKVIMRDNYFMDMENNAYANWKGGKRLKMNRWKNKKWLEHVWKYIDTGVYQNLDMFIKWAKNGGGDDYWFK